jgi:Fe-S oxidoreductase
MDSPRGRIYLMKAGVEGRADLTPSLVTHIDNCLGCLACVTACPSGVQYGPLIERTRARIEQRYPRSIGDRAFRAVLMALVPYPARMRWALRRWRLPAASSSVSRARYRRGAATDRGAVSWRCWNWRLRSRSTGCASVYPR